MMGFHFLHPDWLWLLLVIPVFWAWGYFRRGKKNSWLDVVDSELAPFVLTGQEQSQKTRFILVFSLLAALAILAMAGPAWVKKEVPVFRQQQSLVVALDLSTSMYAADVSPNRLELARFKLLDLLNLRKDGQTGLVVFAGDAFAVSPLTDDTNTIAEQMKSLTPELMPAQGSHPDLAIRQSLELLQQAGAKTGSILLMTDGMSDVALTREAVQMAVAQGYPVAVIAFGSAQGAPIPLRDGGFVTDANGQTVMATLDIAALQALATLGKGVFVQAGIGDDDIQQLAGQWWAAQPAAGLLQGGSRQVDTWVNEGIWLVLLMLPLVVLLFRRGWLAVLALVFVLPHSEPVQAALWNDLWQTPDQQAQTALQAGQAEAASTLFADPDWKAAAAYRAGDYKQAASLYAASKTLEGQYNYGNALARLGKTAEAIAAYEKVLAQNPQHEDAQFNLELLKKQQEQEQQKQQQSQQGQQPNPPQNSQNNGGEQQKQPGQADSQQPQNGDSQGQQQPADAEQAQEEQQKQKEQQEKQDQAQKDNEQAQQDASPEDSMDAQSREQQQATEQWLRRIPDDPAGLWRRKFQYQYQQRARPAQGEAW